MFDKRKRTKWGIVTKIYSSQRQNSRRRNHKMPTYTNMELREWLHEQKLFHELYNNWVQSGYKLELVPSVDRLDDSKWYSLDNIQLMTWGENKQKGHDDMRSGKLKHGNKPQKVVVQYSLDRDKIVEYHSINEAERMTSVNNGSISQCCRGILKTSGGFIWAFK